MNRYLVSLRTREIGIRTALGVESSNVLRLILRVARLFSSILYDIQPHEAVTLPPLCSPAVSPLAAPPKPTPPPSSPPSNSKSRPPTF